MSETRDHISIRIDNILLSLPTSPSKPTIFRVADDIRGIKQKLYEPKVVSVGPFHHGKNHLYKMEQHKLRYLKLLLERRKESSVDKYVMAMRSIEEKARKCYAEPVELSPDEFLQMLILDGCFIIELIRRYTLDELKEGDDEIFQYEQYLSQARHDLMLVENQVPFFALDQLFSMTKTANPDDNFVYLIQLFIDDISPWPEAIEVLQESSTKSADHLLGLIYRIWCSSFTKNTENRPIKTVEEHLVPINSIVELQEAGIKFKKHEESNGLNIKFIEGTLKIPKFSVSDQTESIFRNLIAYEHSFIDNHPKIVTDYAFFMHCLVNSSKDVQILRSRGVFVNLLGDDQMVHNMFTRLGKNIVMNSEFCYSDIYDKVNGHCHRRRNKWLAILRHNYFNSPWAVISFFAALMLLIFTFTQTVFSVLSYVKSK